MIESGTKWTLNQSNEFRVMNSLSTLRPKTKDEHCWNFVPCINMYQQQRKCKHICIQQNIGSTLNRILIQPGAKLKWWTRWMGWCWFPSLKVYEMTPIFFPLVLNHFSVEWKLFCKVCDPLLCQDHIIMILRAVGLPSLGLCKLQGVQLAKILYLQLVI